MNTTLTSLATALRHLARATKQLRAAGHEARLTERANALTYDAVRELRSGWAIHLTARRLLTRARAKLTKDSP